VRRPLLRACTVLIPAGAVLASALLAPAASLPPAERAVSGSAFGESLPGLTVDQRDEAASGFALFIKVWTAAEGLGPLANAQSCVTCHATPMPGGSGTTPRTLVRRVSPSGGGPQGGVVPRFLVDPAGVLLERPLPPHSQLRKTPALYGIGLLEAVPAAVLRERADPDDANGDGISGRLALRGGRASRFGWKSSVVSVEDFVAVALATEMGITSERAREAGASVGAPFEASAEQVVRLAEFVRLLAAPPRTRILPDAEEGRRLFLRLGCESCHRETLRTARDDGGPVSGLVFHPYTDLLLHDMGPELSDGLAEGVALASEFRTPPLWGVSSTGPPYLHDGRARSLDEAILAHGGEAARSSAEFRRLSAEECQALRDFLRSL
jgi:CxxC motif-containing protein (DUF1111 family)